ncbi:tyrosine-protein phosphatase [Bacillus zhangzhouensis]|nr:tyrosine-protein phosphatase [Bacillus zhangzhouensis]
MNTRVQMAGTICSIDEFIPGVKRTNSALLGMQQDYLEDVLHEMLETYGSAERYLIEACKVPEAQLNEMKNMLLTPSAGIPSQKAE